MKVCLSEKIDAVLDLGTLMKVCLSEKIEKISKFKIALQYSDIT